MIASRPPNTKNAMGHSAMRIIAMVRDLFGTSSDSRVCIRLYHLNQIPRQILQQRLGYDTAVAVVPASVPHISVSGIGPRSVSLLWLNACEGHLLAGSLTILINGVEWGCVKGGEPTIHISDLQPQSDYDIQLILNEAQQSSSVHVQTSAETARNRAQSGQSSDSESVSSLPLSRSRSNTPPDLQPLIHRPSTSITSDPSSIKCLPPESDDRLGALKRQESDLQQQIQLENNEAELLHAQLSEERNLLRSRVKDREDRYADLRRKYNASDKLFRTAQNRRAERERVLLQQNHESSKRSEQTSRWADETATHEAEISRLKAEVDSARHSAEAKALRKRASSLQQSQKTIEDDIRKFGTQAKDLEKQQLTRQNSPQSHPNANWKQKEDEMQAQLLSMWQMLQQSQAEEQLAHERFLWLSTKTDDSPGNWLECCSAEKPCKCQVEALTNGAAMSPAADKFLPSGLLFDDESQDIDDFPERTSPFDQDPAPLVQDECPDERPKTISFGHGQFFSGKGSVRLSSDEKSFTDESPPLLGSLRRSQTQSMPRSVGRQAIFDWDSSPPTILRSQTEELRNRASPMSRRRTGSGRSFQMETIKSQIPRSSFETSLSHHERMSSQPTSPFSFDSARIGESSSIWADSTSKRSSGSQGPAPYWTHGLGTWCRRDTHRRHLGHGSSANLSIGSTPLDMDGILETSPGQRAEQAPIGTRPASSKSNGPRLNPAAPSFQTLLNDDASPSRSSPGDTFTLLTGSRTVHVSKNGEEPATLMQRIGRKGSAGKFVVPWAKDRTPPIKQSKGSASTPTRNAKSSKKNGSSSSQRPTSNGEVEVSGGRSWSGIRRKSRKTGKPQREVSAS